MSHSTTSSCRADPDTTAKEIIAVPQEAPASAVETPITVSSIIELDSHIMDLLLSQTLTGTEDTTTAIRGVAPVTQARAAANVNPTEASLTVSFLLQVANDSFLGSRHIPGSAAELQ
jgi:hypothetical protein